MEYLIAVVHIDTDEVVKTLKASNERNALRVKRGIENNLNHDEYEVVVSSLD